MYTTDVFEEKIISSCFIYLFNYLFIYLFIYLFVYFYLYMSSIYCPTEHICMVVKPWESYNEKICGAFANKWLTKKGLH